MKKTLAKSSVMLFALMTAIPILCGVGIMSDVRADTTQVVTGIMQKDSLLAHDTAQFGAVASDLAQPLTSASKNLPAKLRLSASDESNLSILVNPKTNSISSNDRNGFYFKSEYEDQGWVNRGFLS
jgi:hypothetical protein